MHWLQSITANLSVFCCVSKNYWSVRIVAVGVLRFVLVAKLEAAILNIYLVQCLDRSYSIRSCKDR